MATGSTRTRRRSARPRPTASGLLPGHLVGGHAGHGAERAAGRADRRTRARDPDITTADTAERWLEAERTNLVRVILDATGRHSWQIPHLVRDFFYLHSHYDDWLTTHIHALTVARQIDDDGRAEAITSIGIGFVHYRAGRLADAQTDYERAVELRATIEPAQLATALNNLGLLHRCRGHYRRAITLHRRGHELYRTAGRPGGEAHALYAFAHAVARLGHRDVAAGLLHRALELTRRSGRRYGEAIVLGESGIVLGMAGDRDHAESCLRESLALSREVGLRWVEIAALRGLRGLRGLGDLDALRGNHTEAIRNHADALRHA